MSEALEKVSVAQKEIERLSKEIKEHEKVISELGLDAVCDSLIPFFEKYPDVTIWWEQYTPYFNDGDACTFRSGHDYPYIGEDCEETLDRDQARMVSEAFRLFDDNFMLHAFGDGMKVTISKDDIIVDECDHD